MTQYNDAERQAGTLILSQLKMFNEAVVVFEEHIDPAFWKGFDQCIERFTKANNWCGEAEFAQKESVWLAPPSWSIEANTCKYWFENHVTVSKDVDFLLAVMTNTKTEQGEFGFQFKLNADWFGGTRKLNAYANSVDQTYRTQLVALGFDDQGKGNFFLPVILDSKRLAECWQEYGAFPEDHDVFNPLRNTLGILLQSIAIFDAIFSSETGDTTAVADH